MCALALAACGAESSGDVEADAAAAGGAGGEGGAAVDHCADPGRVTLRRLNRFEYDNTMRDLLGDQTQPARTFPDDDIGYGFDNIGDVLSVTALHLEHYESAAERLIVDALSRGVQSSLDIYEAEEIGSDVGASWRDQGWNLWSNGSLVLDLRAPAEGRYTVRVHAFGQQAGPDPVEMALSLDQRVVHTFSVEATQDAPETFAHDLEMSEGSHRIEVTFTNDFYDPENPDPAERDRNLIVDWIEVEGPFDTAPVDPERRASIMVCEPSGDGDLGCARQVLEGFARRAWRRPAESAEIDRLMTLVELAINEGDGIEVGIELGLRATLVSPNFLYRVELDAAPDDLTPHRLSDHELATRLSYFLWGSMPDDELAALADAGGLQDDEAVRAQVERMIADPKASALVNGFADQWLFIRAMNDLQPDYNYFPEFDEDLRAAMIEEARRFYGHGLAENMSLPELMTADWTFVNGRLADHYALDFDGDDFKLVSLADSPRGGLLTLGSVLTATSFPTRTSPVKRGKWVLDQILCTPPPPPPPGVEAELGEVNPDVPFREQLAQHRADPACAACHNQMDPLGLGMDNFDGIGAFRSMDGEHPVDAFGELPNGETFDGAVELGQVLADDARLHKCYTEKLFIYALGRGPEAYDTCALQNIERAAESSEHRLQDWLMHVATSPQFTMRRGEAE